MTIDTTGTFNTYKISQIKLYFSSLSGVGDGNGADLSFEIIINGSTVFTLDLSNSRQGQVCELSEIRTLFNLLPPL